MVNRAEQDTIVYLLIAGKVAKAVSSQGSDRSTKTLRFKDSLAVSVQKLTG